MAMPDPTTPPAAARLVRPDYSTDTVASGPSVILDDRALENSPVPSQLTQQAGGGRLPRQRPRFYTVQDLDVALNQAIEGKINSKNAWASKEASDLLEGITHTIENTLENDTTDNYSGFAKAATVVEGCSKVWTSRVDSTHLRSNLMVQRLLRNEEDSGAGPTESGEGEESEAQESQSRRARSRAKTMARTLAMEASEINLDSKAMTALTQTGLNAQFRAITEKFDQGNAQGLLTNNAPLGRVGNVILDVDYSQVVGQFSAKKAKQLARGTDSAVSSARTSGEVCVKVEEGQVSGNSSARPSLLHQAVFLPVEEDGDIDVVLDDLPEFLPRTSGELDDVPRASHHTALRGSAGVREGGAAVSDLLALNHAAFVKEEAEEAVVAPAAVASHHVSLGYQADEEHPLPLDDDGDYGGDDFGGMGDDITYAEDEDDDDGAADVGAEARQLVTGIRELEAVDSLFAGGVQLALEAENPTSWCPMADIPQNALAGPAPGSELSQLHKKCRLGATGGGGDAGATAKRAKKEGRTVTFDASVIGAHVANAASSPTFSLNQSDTDQGALKQSTTSTKNVTPLGRDLLFKKEASQLATSFMQSTTQKAKAEEAHLLLPSPPIPGTTLPDFLPYPVTIASFFQPFSTSLSEWNLLRKSVSGRILDEAAELRRSGGASTEEEGPRSAMGDLPMEFFPTGAEADDDDLGGYGDYDGHSDVDSVAEYQLNAEKQLLAQFEAVTTSAAASADASARGSAGDNPARLSTDPEVLLKALHPTAAIMANQVDVVRLRQTMWEALQSIMKENPHVKMAEEEDSGEAAAEAEKIGAADESVMKRHALRALHRGQRGKRPREAESISERRQNTAEVEEDENEDHHLPSEMDALLPHFSEVVQRILPEVPSISSTGSLSPAFLFFSMLFLVNEHNIVLANAPTLDDLTVRGTKSRIGVVKA